MRQNSTDNKLHTTLLEEYKQISAAFDKQAGATYNLPPIVLTLITGFFFFSQSASSEFIGFGVTLSIFLLVIWLGLIQSTMNHLGVQLASLEVRINKLLALPEMNQGLSFFYRYCGQGFQRVPGYQMYFFLITLLVMILVIPASVKSWYTMTIWQWSLIFKILCTAIPYLLFVVVMVTMRYVDNKAFEQIKVLLENEYPKLSTTSRIFE